ncbi:major facilitator superfamily domain-containing protein [Aspergillus insuetus]
MAMLAIVPELRDELPFDPDEGLSDEEKKQIDDRLFRRLDLRLLPWLSLLTLAGFLDRTNMGNAKIEGLQEALRLTNSQYNASLTIFFIPYALFEPFTNVLLKRMGPKLFIPSIMLTWGTVMTLMGLLQHFSDLMAARWFLGLAKACLSPGISHYLSCWYRRSGFGLRMAISFSSAALAGSFGGLLAAGISKMDGVAGKPGWAWIFMLEGLATVALALVSFRLLVGFPDKDEFLSQSNKHRVIRLLAMDQQSSARHQEWSVHFVWASLRDWKTNTGLLIYMGAGQSLYAFALFLPTIVEEMCYTSTTAQLLTAAPNAFAFLATVSIGYIGDTTRSRGILNIISALIGMTGFCMLIAASTAASRYAGTFLEAMAIFPCVGNTIAWTSNNVEGFYKRGITLGIMIGWCNLNGIVSSTIYRGQNAPNFYLGHGVVLGYLTVCLFFSSILQTVLLRIENRKRLSGQRDVWMQGLDSWQIELLGDMRPDFIYTT